MRFQISISILFFLLTGCKVTESMLPGKYVDSQRDDTVRLMANNTYEYEERLYNRTHGWNTGNWEWKNGRLRFLNTNPLPIVGYKIKIDQLGIGPDPLQLVCKLNSSNRELKILAFGIYNKGHLLDTGSSHAIANQLVIKTTNFDSLTIETAYFPIMGINNHRFEKNGRYRIVFFSC